MWRQRCQWWRRPDPRRVVLATWAPVVDIDAGPPGLLTLDVRHDRGDGTPPALLLTLVMPQPAARAIAEALNHATHNGETP